MKVRVSAPGKTILMGEHAAVYGRPALVAAIDRRLRVEIEPAAAGVELDLPQVGVREPTSWDEIERYSAERRRRWRSFIERPGADRLPLLLGDDPAHLVKVALGESAAELGLDPAARPALRLRVDSEIPVGAGFGSSAALAVGVSLAFLAFCGADPDPERLHRLAQEAERRQHGTPSGIDSAAVLHGGLISTRRGVGEGLEIEAIEVRSSLLGAFRIFHTGDPRESTGAVVAAVRDLRDRRPRRFARTIDRLEEATDEVRTLLETAGADPRQLLSPIRDFEAGLEELGVVPPRVRDLVRRIENAGGAAKISGAGSLSDPGAGSLLVYHPRPEEIAGWPFLGALEPLDIGLGAAAATVETSE